MRWRFSDPTNSDEAGRRTAITAKMDSWWHAFGQQTDDLKALFSRKKDWDLPAWMEQNLQAIDPRLMWEFGPAVRGDGHRLVITPESMRHLRPLVRTLLDRAPVIAGWEFYQYRLAEGLELAKVSVEGRTGYSIADIKFRAALGEHHRIDLTFASPAIKDRGDQAALNAAFVAVESLLGEQSLDEWIGVIEVAPPPRTRGLKSLFGFGETDWSGFHGLDRLRETVDALIGSIHDQCPPKPHYDWVETAEWTLWQLQPEQADDYVEQQDLLVVKSPNPPLWTAAHIGGMFSSQRFSRCGETFCYIKLDGSQGLDQSAFADKSEIEDAVDAVLKPAFLGCQIGGGTGLRYSYIDLALTDLDKGIEATKMRLRSGKVPKRSWIQFFDSDLAAEWVGIYDDTPAPPMELDS